MQSRLPQKCTIVNVTIVPHSAFIFIVFTKVTQLSDFRFHLFMPNSTNSDKKRINLKYIYWLCYFLAKHCAAPWGRQRQCSLGSLAFKKT